MISDIYGTYYRFVPGRQMDRTCWLIQRKTLLGWSKAGTAWHYENAADEAQALNGIDPKLRDRKIPYIERSAGGPVLHMSTGYKHFLTLGERISWAMGRTDAYRLQMKRKAIAARAPKSAADMIGK